MYFDAERNAYIDRDTGEVVFQEAEDSFEEVLPVQENSFRHLRSNQNHHFEGDYALGVTGTPPRTNRSHRSNRSNRNSRRSNADPRLSARQLLENFMFPKGTTSPATSTTANETSYYSNRFGSPRSRSHDTGDGGRSAYLEGDAIELGNISFSADPIPGTTDDHKIAMEEELYQIHVNNSYDVVSPTENDRTNNPTSWDDWTLARALQALEFEIPEETNPYEDFNNTEYNASKSCRRQLMTVSFLICLAQIGMLIAMFEKDGTAPESENSAIGPPVYSLVRFGAKDAALIVWKNQYWRLLSSIMVHAGILHIIPNVLIQLRIGGYLNLVYGTWRWLFIYFISGIFGEIMSCLFLANDVGVGSSGALMGLLASWVVWILVRWNKIPPECRSQRNCQLCTVVIAILVTLATSFMPAVDYCAHAGGAFQGVLWGVVLLGNGIETDNHRQNALRFFCGVIAVTSYVYAIYYLAVDLKPSTASLSYWASNDDWHR